MYHFDGDILAGWIPGKKEKSGNPSPSSTGFWVTAIAISTGGPQTLARIIPKLPANYPVPIVLVQHMPPTFTASLAQSLDSKSAIKVVEARSGMILVPGTVYIAPGGKHLVVRSVNGKPVALLNENPPEKSVRPSADVLFRSLASIRTSQSVLAVILTGMGEDGLEGVRNLKQTGCYCLTQSEESCVIFGMPRSVAEAGLSDETVAMDNVANRMVQLVTRTPSRLKSS